ncbi:glycoside hydrolase family 25 protein [Pseudaminobacter sp. 19-2017]|uniref:Glycoside hydrolase family 25 protein n=1 Tax=Pseudaminobacter soli (ex Zhang et al. 2022) TaxID=2831468 RepID=A0A942E0Y3_9HYPH|nr:GH25 family lysozyme [Pseudaminobacter soli]MBS3649163.1 glycoside hydrolase family 25 protein [Pseudaminobacter soli]
MRRLAALALACLVAGCSTIDDLGVSSSASMLPPQNAKATVGYPVMLNPRFGDNDPHEWTARTPFQYAVHGTDVSKYQRTVDWATARASGISFAFIKATEGGDRVDDKFQEHWHGAKTAGIPRGAYHFYYFCRPAAEQARWYIANVPRDRSSLPPVLDMEWNPSSPTCKLRPPAETVRSEMRIFLSMVEKHYGKKPIIYTSIDFFEDNNLASFTGYHYWLRSVADHPSDRYGAHPFVFWQYTGTGVVPGIKGNADLNVFNGSHADWRKWISTNEG